MTTKRKTALMYLDEKALDALNTLAKKTRIPRAVLTREAIDDLLVKYSSTLKMTIKKKG